MDDEKNIEHCQNQSLAKELIRHYEHEVEVGKYASDDGTILNLAIECMYCNEVIIDTGETVNRWYSFLMFWR